MKRGKKYQEAAKKVDKSKEYTLQEAAELVKSVAFAKFNETVEISVALSLKNPGLSVNFSSPGLRQCVTNAEVTFS